MKHYNRVRTCAFVFDRRLDATGPDSQPEAAYLDEHTGEGLVIERKSLIWPPDFAQLHATSHEIAGIVESELNHLLDARRAYRLTLRDDLRGPRTELRTYARAVARAIRRRIDVVHGGTALQAEWPNRDWSFREERASERDFTQRSTGLIVEFNVRTTELDYGDISQEFAAEFERLLTAAAKKFEGYRSAKRILVIDPYADVRWSTDETWANCSPPLQFRR